MAKKTIQELKAENEALRMALKPFADFAAAWNKNPMRGLHDELYGIHDKAFLRLSDCRRALELLKK